MDTQICQESEKNRTIYQNIVIDKTKVETYTFQIWIACTKTVQEAYALGKIEGNNDWATAIDKEVKLLRDVYQCFKILPRGLIPPKK